MEISNSLVSAQLLPRCRVPIKSMLRSTTRRTAANLSALPGMAFRHQPSRVNWAWRPQLPAKR
jgi:hypothetical protein